MSIRLIDSHTHVHFKAFEEDRGEVIARAREAGVGMITVGTQIETSRKGIELARLHDHLWATVGLHPNHTTEQEFVDEDEVDTIAHVKTRTEVFDFDAYLPLARDPKCVGIGECGLDYYRIPEQLVREEVIETQRKTVRGHFALATEVGKPVVIHCRDAYADQAVMIEEAIASGELGARGVIHCFTGTLEEARRFVDLGFLISFSGIVTFAKELALVAKALPLESLLVETDAPYLSPVPVRGKRNEPANVVHVAHFLAELKSISAEEVERATLQNTCRVFNLVY